MKKITFHHAIFLLSLLLIVFLSWTTATAQSQNLLTDPGFEGPFVAFDGQAPRMVAQGWNPWNVPRTADMPSYQNTQPKYQAVAPNTARIRSGNNAQEYYSFFEAHDGGVYQRVTGITSGTELRFSLYIYVWSSTYNDVNVSEEPGNVFVQVGIDPTGGTDGQSSNIVWSTAVEQYDAYREYSVIATATNSAVTVFVRSRVAGFPVQHTEVYLDDAVLAPTTGSQPAETEQPTVVPTNTSVPPTNTSVPPSQTPIPVGPTATSSDIGIIPTSTPAPTNTPVPPSNTPAPSNTPIPTNTTVPGLETPTPEGGETVPQPELPTNTPFTIPTATNIPSGGETTPISSQFPGSIIHTVRRGDTVGNLAQLYGSTIEVIQEANGLDSNMVIYAGQGLVIPVRIPNPATDTPTPTPIVVVVTATQSAGGAGGGTGGAANTYLVRPGDTLGSIATRFNTTVATLAQINGIVNANRIFIGQTLTLPLPETTAPEVEETVVTEQPPAPAPATYVVQPGDNLYRISLRFNVNIQRLADVNGITDYNRVFIGQVLTIP